MNEYELIGRLADLDARLKKLEGLLTAETPPPPPLPPQPQSLIEAVDVFPVIFDKTNYKELGAIWIEFCHKLCDVKEAAKREKKGQELVHKVMGHCDSETAIYANAEAILREIGELEVIKGDGCEVME